MSGRSREYDHLLKYVIVGDSSVGKSCLLLRFADDQFNENYMTTIGVDFRFKTVNSNERNIKLQIWDTAGQERFRTITNTYYKSAHAVILVYDITSLETFQSIENFWLNEVESYADPGAKLVLVGNFLFYSGNKADLAEERAVPFEKAETFAKEKGMIFFETSAKTAEHVNDSFMTVTSELVKELEKTKVKNKQELKNNISLDNSAQQANKGNTGCCGY